LGARFAKQNMRVKSIIFLSIILVSCIPSPSSQGTETPSVSINSETYVPALTLVACPPDHLIYDLHAPENVNELIGQHFSYPMPQQNLEDIRFKLMRFLNGSSNYVLTQIDVGNESTLMLGKIVCDEKINQASPQTYGFYLIKGLVLLPDGNEHERINLNCLVNGAIDGSVAGWGYYEPNTNENKKPQYAWRINELTESIEEMETDNVECWFGGAF
jgi:hypothetical protein